MAIKWPICEIYEVIGPFLRNMEHDSAFSAFQECVEKDILTVLQVTEIFPFWSRNHATQIIEEQRGEHGS